MQSRKGNYASCFFYVTNVTLRALQLDKTCSFFHTAQCVKPPHKQYTSTVRTVQKHRFNLAKWQAGDGGARNCWCRQKLDVSQLLTQTDVNVRPPATLVNHVNLPILVSSCSSRRSLPLQLGTGKGRHRGDDSHRLISVTDHGGSAASDRELEHNRKIWSITRLR